MTMWIHPLSAEVGESAEVLGGKAHGLVVLGRLGLPVPPGFVISTRACRAFFRDGRLPSGLACELAAAVAGLEAATHRGLGAAERPLTVSVRSGASVSMPGMMSTVLNLGLTAEATTALADETGDLRFALDSRLRFLAGFASEVLGVGRERLAAAARAIAEQDTGAGTGSGPGTGRLAEAIRDVERIVREHSGAPVPDEPTRQLELAIAAVFSSWHTPRAQTYRALHGIPGDLGTAVTVQAMVYGNRGRRSGTGVAFSRDPNTGEPAPFGEVLFGGQGDDVVAGRSLSRPLPELADREPTVWARLLNALDRLEEHYRDACHVEFTFEEGELWILQVRPGRFVGRAAVRVAVDLADAGTIGRDEAILRVSPQHLQHVRTSRIAVDDARDVLTRGLGACPGVAAGRVATTADNAARLAAQGPVVLVRPETSPLDMHGLAAAAGVVTALGGPTSHAAVVARAMGKPAVVGAADLTVEDGIGVRAGGRALPEGTLIAIDGTGGEVVVGDPRVVSAATDPQLRRLLTWADEIADPHGADADEARRLASARTVLLRRQGASGS
ncbi:pyruvate, phosphate dikinase [Streptomyces sp. ID05-04B]|uniref:pyruvate, phosphate dikinase n=1 Tax=unclassified Streptomyces TaxID=2593676 RepID=UPI000D1AE81C|nr:MULTISPECIES: pyruvate, phosphate dikinase [unclassified Streptomyces]AVV47102.1 pyruvate, phosphate dikinase [Streptomyces sp. P3]MDX5566591.1 pyruvate, phosphate dikinase [Streptomyces sp. ID05-04B]